MTRRTSIKLIKRAISENWVRQLAFYHLLKFNFNNSCVYGYRSRMDEIAGKLNISQRTLHRYLNFLKSKGMVCNHANNLKLISINEFGIRIKAMISISSDMNLFDISCLLYCKIIEQRARQQAFAESIRRIGGVDKYISKLCETPFRPSFSYRSLAKLLNTSEYKAFKIIKNLTRLGMIDSENQRPRLVSNNFTDLKSVGDYPGYRYNIDGRLYEIFGARFSFLHFPICLKKISLQQYRKFVKLKTAFLYICLYGCYVFGK